MASIGESLASPEALPSWARQPARLVAAYIGFYVVATAIIGLLLGLLLAGVAQLVWRISPREAWLKKYGKHSPGRQALLAELDAVFADVDRLVVKESGVSDSPVLFESGAAEDIRSLQDCLAFVRGRR